MATYTDLDDIKRILRSSDREVVRFSDSLTDIRVKSSDSNRAIGFDDSQVVVDPSFDAKLSIAFKFSSDTEFNVWWVDRSRNEDLLISANQLKSDDYTTPNGMIVFPSDCWIGDFDDGDVITITFDPHMSNEDAERYMKDAEVEIDSILAANQIRFFQETSGGDNFYPIAAEVPPPVAVAASYLAAYYIFTDVFLTVLKDGGADGTYAGRWKGRAEKYIKNFMEAEGYSPPLALAFPKYIDKFGVPGEGPGMGGLTDSLQEIERDAETEKVFEKQYGDGWPYDWTW